MKPGPENIAALVRAGLLDPAAMDAEGAAGPVAPTCSHLERIKFRHGWLLAPVALVALFIAVIQVRRDALGTTLKRVEKGAGKPRLTLPIFSEAMVAAAFHLLRQFLPLDNLCLARSIAISRMLRRFGHQATLVIGVQLPIAAHCWVQCGDKLMADRVERIAAFEPILAR
ncbi:lasso peptide biosynthesis B2 protein [Sphingobium yanoikuyae]|uniref:lasso peptide biosynthesis B2 protein n=1 Tax=Sphingobium yanoikuyae TaxID=13690 RepID=UPI0035B0379E